ncbi:MAG: ribonuclease domain-containing protein [Pseudomonadota bacterium]
MTRAWVALLGLLVLAPAAEAASCRDVVHAFNQQSRPHIDEAELMQALQTLNADRNTRLPDKFVTKREAQSAGWQRGHSLWSAPALQGKSIGGDRFGNRERQLPYGQWREADLDYHGGHRGAKRLVFSREGRRFVTVDHYRTFTEIPACQ